VAEILGLPFDRLVPPEQRKELEVVMQRLKSGEVIENFDAPRLRKDGQLVEVSISHSPVNDDTGAIIGISAIMRDVGERKKLQAEILRISEREQSRIAQDLHDGLGQQLVGIFCLSDVLKKNLADRGSPAAQQAARISKLLHSAVAQTRGLARGLLPVAAEPGGLMAALGEMANHLTSLFKIRCHFDCPEPVLIENPAVAGHFFRIAQEAATNSIKHGRAQDITIELSSTPERITLAIRDDGVGLRKAARRSEGLGLRIMHHRAEVIGGTLAVQKHIGGGTEVLCTLEKPGTNTQHGQS
jgi:signal transduction histidine kinase